MSSAFAIVPQPPSPPSAAKQNAKHATEWAVAVSAPPTVPPVAVNDRVYVALRSGAIVAHRLSNGAQLWSVELSVEQPLAVDETHVFVVSGDMLHALEGASGRTSWRAPASEITAPPFVQAGWVIVAAADALNAFRATDGARLWRTEIGRVEQRPFIDGDTLYVSLVDARVVALDLQNGTPHWERLLSAAPGEPLAADGRLYVGAGKYFYCLQTDTGEIDWRIRVGAEVRARPAIDTDHVYFAAMDNELRALDRHSGAIRWHKGVPFRPSGGPILLGEAVGVPGPVAELRIFEAKTGKPLKGPAFGEPIVTTPAILPGAGLTDVRIAAVTGGLNNQWMLTVLGPAADAPATVPVVPLTVLPGVVLDLLMPAPPCDTFELGTHCGPEA